MRLLLFELKKVIFDKKFLYLILILIAGIVALFMRNVIFQSYIEKEALEEVESYVSTSQSNARLHRDSLKSDPDNEELQTLESINLDMLDTLSELRDIIETDDCQMELRLKNDFFVNTANYKNKEGDHPLTFEEIEQAIALNEKLLEENIKPEHDTFSKALPNFLKIVMDVFINFGAIIMIILFIGDVFSSEYENRSVNLLFTQPLNKTHLVTSKFISSIFIYIFLTLSVIIATTMVGLLFGSDGTFEYPILIEINDGYEFMTIREYISQGIIMASAIVLMTISLSMLLGILFKHTLTTLLVLLGILLGGYVMILIPWDPIFWINPFQYVFAQEMIINQVNSVWYQGIPAALLVTIVCYLMSLHQIKTSKMDIS